ncbi:insulin-like 5a [Boleophthalmus pectinirostris]|uniref:insulin-like 5a n=1 Tax=Boleophthalmus pectinirostris TaxID=150288 RepID=UPI000A1C2621|nr:insulin-like 5a [Boleophthalmus pectinirostris]
MSRMYKALVPVALLLLCTALLRVQAQEVKAVKLCGREFLRAVVYTCGGSRWRRSGTEDDGSLSEESAGTWGPRMELRRRDMNSILTSVCCTMGCRKSDLSLLC